MNTWWKIADMLERDGAFEDIQYALKVVAGSEMPDDVKAEALELAAAVTKLQTRLEEHSKRVLSNMDGVMWPVI